MLFILWFVTPVYTKKQIKIINRSETKNIFNELNRYLNNTAIILSEAIFYFILKYLIKRKWSLFIWRIQFPISSVVPSTPNDNQWNIFEQILTIVVLTSSDQNLWSNCTIYHYFKFLNLYCYIHYYPATKKSKWFECPTKISIHPSNCYLIKKL